MFRNIYSSIFLLSLFLLFLIAIDLTPYLRGPAPYPPDWRWSYELSNTLGKIWLPLITICAIIAVAFQAERSKKLNRNKTILTYVFIYLMLGFLLQISIIFYSRAGLGVIMHRVINPMISGYFTASLDITNLGEFIRNFNTNLAGYPMYARFHPPGGIIFSHLITIIVGPFTSLFSNILNFLPAHGDVAMIWNSLSDAQKLNALMSGFITALLASLTIIPLYLVARILYSAKTAFRSIPIFLFVPSVLLFTPLIDVFLPLFTASSLYLFIKAKVKKRNNLYLISGLVLFLGIFFSLTFIPVILFFLIYFFLENLRTKVFEFNEFKPIVYFSLGILAPILVLYFFGLNFIDMMFKIINFHELAQSSRDHLVWFFYNIYDFLIFAGIPTGFLLILMTYKRFIGVINKRKYKTSDSIFVSFILMMSALLITGAVRGETARIWLPFVPFVILSVSNFITKDLKWNTRIYIGLLILLSIQVIIFQTVLVTVW